MPTVLHRRIVLLGPPAAGKGTQAEMLKREFGFDTPSVGAMLRQQKAAGTPAGLQAATYFDRGLLVPDEITIEVVRQWLGTRDGSWVLDGFPRTMMQAEAFEVMLAREGFAVDAVILLNVGDAVIRDRASRRLVCSACGGIFSTGLHVAHAGESCPRCDGTLARRIDDEPATVTQRLAEYRERTEPLIPHYRGLGLLREFDGDRLPEQIFADLTETLGSAIPSSS